MNNNKGAPKEPYYQPSLYAITINPSDAYNKIFTGTGKRTMQLHDSTTLSRYNDIQEWLTPILKNYKYTLYWDVSCPTDISVNKIPRLHLHGIIDLRDVMYLEEFLLVTSQRLAAGSSVKMVKLEDTENIQNWQAYCKKYTNVIRRDPLVN